MRSRVSRRFKAVGSLNGIDLSDIFGAATAVANTVSSVVNSNKSTFVPTATSSGGTSINDLLPFLLNNNSGNNNTPAPAASQDNTLLYVGGGVLALGVLGTLAYVVTRPSGGKKK